MFVEYQRGGIGTPELQLGDFVSFRSLIMNTKRSWWLQFVWDFLLFADQILSTKRFSRAQATRCVQLEHRPLCPGRRRVTRPSPSWTASGSSSRRSSGKGWTFSQSKGIEINCRKVLTAKLLTSKSVFYHLLYNLYAPIIYCDLNKFKLISVARLSTSSCMHKYRNHKYSSIYFPEPSRRGWSRRCGGSLPWSWSVPTRPTWRPSSPWSAWSRPSSPPRTSPGERNTHRDLNWLEEWHVLTHSVLLSKDSTLNISWLNSPSRPTDLCITRSSKLYLY